MVHAIRPVTRPHPEANRIAGFAVAISVNVVLFMLALAPMRLPVAAPPPDDLVVVPIKEATPPPRPPQPVKVAVTRPVTTPTPALRPQPQLLVTQDDVVVEGGSEPATPVVPDTGPAILPADPLPGVRLEYASAPAPAYPRDALRDGATGTVLLQVLVDVDGRPLDVQIARSSGNRSLDRAARDQVLRRWRFRAAMQDGRAVQAIGLVPVAFTLD